MRQTNIKKTIIGILFATIPVAAITGLLIRRRHAKTYAGR